MSGLAMVVWIALAAGSGPHAPRGRWLPPGVENLDTPLRDARVGDWVSYRIGGGAGREGHWRMAVVGEEVDAWGRSAVWLEMEFGADARLASPLLRFRMLVAREAGLVVGGVSRLIFALGFDRPQELEPSAIERVLASRGPGESAGQNRHSASRPLFPAATDDEPMVRRGTRLRLLTAAGSVLATPVELFYRGALVQRFWISPELPVLHLARIDLPATSHTMEATGYGHDATSRIPEPAPSSPRIRLERQVDEAGGL